MSSLRKSSCPSAHSTPEAPSQDWVCLKCNNLNFSFRKRCNRCKVQSREDNQLLLYADYYYNHYNHYYNYPQQPQPQPQQPEPNRPQPSLAPIEATPLPLKLYESEGEIAEREVDELPSVSPLVKKYGSGRERRKAGGSRGLFLWKLFGEQSWSQGQLPAVVAPDLSKDLSLTDDDASSYEFTRSVEQMII